MMEIEMRKYVNIRKLGPKLVEAKTKCVLWLW